jgi:transcriptional regulator with XRE-family HTH domain
MEEKTATNIKKVLKMIRDVRKNKGLTHENMAYELNMSPSAYNKLERSETTLSLERLLKIKDILDLPLSDLFELKTYYTFNQDLKDNAIGNVQNLYQENKEINEKLIQTLQEEIVFLRELFKEK